MKNKYNTGDKVWRMVNNKAEESLITTISNYIGRTIYGFELAGKYGHCLFGSDITASLESYEEDLFSTKEDLLKSL